MTYAEEFGINCLEEFVEKTNSVGIRYDNESIERNLQNLIVSIVIDYINEVKNGE